MRRIIIGLGKAIAFLLRGPLGWAALLLGLLLFLRLSPWWTSPANWFRSQPVRIAETPLVIQEIRSIAQLQTARLYAELVVDSTEITQFDVASRAIRELMPLPLPKGRQLVLIVRGRVTAGVDLTSPESLRVVAAGDSVSLEMPPAGILDVQTNPGDVEIFLEEGYWSEADVRAVKEKARRRLIAEAERRDLLAQADRKAAEAMEAFLAAAGFRRISIRTR